MPNLNDLGVKYQTDKSELRHNYLPLYEQHLGPVRLNPITLLELGVLDGASLRMWREWLPNATIVGLDQHPPIAVDGCIVLQGEQDDPAAIAKAAKYGPFDVVVDDASHQASKTRSSFELLFQHLKPGGRYFIEDLHSSFWPAIYGDEEADQDPDTTKPTTMRWLKRLTDETQFDPAQHPSEDGPRWAIFPRKYWLGYHLQSIEFHYGICVIHKHSDAQR